MESWSSEVKLSFCQILWFGLPTVIVADSNDLNTTATGQFSSLRIKGVSMLSNGSSQFLFFVLRI